VKPDSSSFFSKTGMPAAVLPFLQSSSAIAVLAAWRVLDVAAIEKGKLGAIGRVAALRVGGDRQDEH